MIRQLQLTTILGKFYLFPVPVVKERKYLILCPSESAAEVLRLAVHAQKVTHPDLVSEDFLFLTFHTDERTKIYTLNPRIIL